MRRFSDHLRGNVVAYVALFAALSGTAWAATELDKNGVKSKHIGKGQVKNADLARNSVTSPKVANGSLASEDFAPGQLPQGPQGIPGEQGPRGEQGPPGPATGAAGGDLTGTYPNPLIGTDAVGANEIADGSLGTAELSSSIPAARVTHSVNQTIGTGGVTSLQFDTELYDTANLHDPGNNSRLTAPVDGIYAISASIQWAPTAATGVRDLRLQRTSGVAFQGWLAIDTRDDLASASTGTSHEVTTVASLQAGDFMRVQVVQDSGGDLNVNANPEFSPEFSMTWLAPG